MIATRPNHPLASLLLAGSLAAAAAAPVQAEPESTATLRVVTFAETRTATHMHARDYVRVIDGSRSLFSEYGFHDLVNLCAAYAFERRYVEAERACDQAIRYRPASMLRGRPDLRAERWAAYANRAVVRALSGQPRGADADFARADNAGGGAAAVIVAHNRAVLDAGHVPALASIVSTP